MSIEKDDAGLAQVLLDRFEKQRLPRISEIKEQLDRGNKLNEFDIEYLSEALHDAKTLFPFLERHPEYKALLSSVFHYYKLITDEALEVENKSI